MKKITMSAVKNLIIGSAFAFVAVLSPLVLSPSANAVTCSGGKVANADNTKCVAACSDDNLTATSGINCAKGNDVPTTLFGEGSIFTTVVNVLLFVIGAISVIMLIFGGIRYTVSGGDSANVTAAKNTIMYALIGLVVAFLAFAIVNWVLGAIS